MTPSLLLDLTRLATNETNGGTQDPIGTPNLTWLNVAIAGCFILFNCGVSLFLELKLEKSLIIAAVRCLVQLTIMGYILEDVFKANNPLIVLGMTIVLILLGAYETVYNKSKQSYSGMFLSVLMSTACSVLLVGIIGTKWAMDETPFWAPQTFIPTMGMLLGNLLSGMAVALSSCLSSVSSNKEQMETYLAFGASRWEAGQSIAVEAVRLAMLPTINQMSVIGLISIPGMMSGSILGGAPIMNAVRYQQIIMFMISAATALGVLGAVVFCIQVMIDGRDRLRPERIIHGRPSLWKDVKQLLMNAYRGLRYLFCMCRKQKTVDDHWSGQDHFDDGEQRQPLLH
ncbi:uncharacterized protein BX664DRAFT_204121 [Halteromyces radiatus]|uniref:uncharacterized protein n=1 Tax=Halteromyces radiatus TaxID=101107 RepID=UPI00221FABA0|nr:uncharacterized protein BX664DRAFT_204121 [Halteromyces radiatus]KAI8079873.1 hypothetical protein BX664DRAFT_204121 [Halteromyces radiatus]